MRKCKHAPPRRSQPTTGGRKHHLGPPFVEKDRGAHEAFQSNKVVSGSSREAKRIVKAYNKVARTLVAFEYLWYEAWCKSVDAAKAGLRATLIIRHPQHNTLHVNFDAQVLQLIREAKCLQRMGVEIPEGARTVQSQEQRFKGYYDEFRSCLSDFDRITSTISPTTLKALGTARRHRRSRLTAGHGGPDVDLDEPRSLCLESPSSLEPARTPRRARSMIW